MREGHVALWHPWYDKPGQRHQLALWEQFRTLEPDAALRAIGTGKQYALCSDIFDPEQVPDALLLDKRTKAYLSRTGQISALQVRIGRSSGFLIQSLHWGSESPDKGVSEGIKRTFEAFNYEALTPSALSEKVLRSTLPEKVYISRPSVMLRTTLLDNKRGGRIEKAAIKKFYPRVYEYDINKAYLSFCRETPTPYNAPITFYGSPYWEDCPTSFLHVQMIAHGKKIHPIQVWDPEEQSLRSPHNGEQLDIWIWREELEGCLSHGYTLHKVVEGYAWLMMSDWMSAWVDILWTKYQKYSNDPFVSSCIKNMMVGQVGRFQKAPETLSLIHQSDARKGDIALVAVNFRQSPFTEWYMRIEPDLESAQLTPIGAYVVMRCRMELYEKAMLAQKEGKKILRLYVDSLTSDQPLHNLELGEGLGEYREKVYADAVFRKNQFLGTHDGVPILKAPGVGDRAKLIEELRNNEAI